MIQWKLGCQSRKQKRENQLIARPGIEYCHWFIHPLLHATPTMQFSIDHKRRSHKQNPCSASDSVDLIFTTTYRSIRFWLRLRLRRLWKPAFNNTFLCMRRNFWLVGEILQNKYFNILTGQKRDMTELKLVWPVNTTGHRSKIILSPASVSTAFPSSPKLSRVFVIYRFRPA